MLGGAIIAIVSWVALGFALLGIAYALSWILAREHPRPDPMNQPFGDYPNVNGTFHGVTNIPEEQ